MGKKSAPKAPDPYQTAQAQGQMNRDTAIAQQQINMTDQVNPWGATNYTQNGSTTYTDSFGKVVTLPKFTQTTVLSPEQQAIFDKTQGAQTNLANIAKDQSGRVAETLSDPFKFDNQDAADWSYDLAQTRIAPQQQQNQRDLENRLVNSGIRPGTAAWDREMSRLSMANTDQNNQLALTGRGQAFSEAMATRNQPINELTALLSGSQISNPAQMSGATPQANVGGVDYTGLVKDKYNAEMNAYQSSMGGIFGLLGTGAKIAASDMRLKTDISRVRTLGNGLPVYSYRYLTDSPLAPLREGLIAQDVAKVNPGAIVPMGNGYMAVDYALAVQ